MKMIRVLFSPGKTNFSLFRKELNSSSGFMVVGVLLNNHKKRPEWFADKTELPTYVIEDFYHPKTNNETTPLHEQYEKILNSILKDSRTYYLIERIFCTSPFDSVFNYIVRIEKIVWNSLSMFYVSKPDRLVFNNTPHNLNWFVAKVADQLGIEVLLARKSPIPYKKWIVRGLDEQNPVIHSAGYQRSNNQDVKEYINKVRRSYEEAIPVYEKRRQDKYKGRFFNLKTDIRGLFDTQSFTNFLWRFVSLYKKWNALRLYTSMSKSYEHPDKFVVFFMHFQPERTTLPEGFSFAQQWLAIKKLSVALPEGWKLVVKEHPSTFRNFYSPKVRDNYLYHAINSLPNVVFAPLSTSPFELIDKAMVVATITGTVGLEALIRLKPVLVFGVSSYKAAKHIYSVHTIEDIKNAFNSILNINKVRDENSVMQFFNLVDKNSYTTYKNSKYTESAFLKAFSIPLETVAAKSGE